MFFQKSVTFRKKVKKEPLLFFIAVDIFLCQLLSNYVNSYFFIFDKKQSLENNLSNDFSCDFQ